MDAFSKKVRSKIMSTIKGKNSKPELKFRKILSRAGYKYRTNYKIGRYRIDAVLIKEKIAIFIDGCFWHRCPKCFVYPKSNKKYWITKIDKNVVRDKKIDAFLRTKNWRPIHFWEHEIKRMSESPAYGYSLLMRRLG